MAEQKCNWIVFEGVDGSGKSTQAKLLAQFLKEQCYKVNLTREPGGTKEAEKIRALIMDPQVNCDPKIALCLFLADRALHIKRGIKPAIKENDFLICDRYEGSTFAYQCFAGNLPLSSVREFNNFITGSFAPDLTIVVDLPPEEALIRAQRNDVNHYDKRPLEYYQKVRDGFLQLAKMAAHHKPWVVIDGLGSIEEVHQNVLKCLQEQKMLPK